MIGPLQMLARQVGQPGTMPNQGGMMNNPNAAQPNMVSGPGGAPQPQFTNAMGPGGAGPGGMMMVNQAGGMVPANQAPGQMMTGSGPGQPVMPGGLVVGAPRGPMTSSAGLTPQQQQQMQRMSQQRFMRLQQAQQQNVPISQAGMPGQPGMMNAGAPQPQTMAARPPFQGGVQGGAGGPGMGPSSVGNVMSAGNVPMNTLSVVSPSPSGNQMSNNQIIRSPANYNPMLPSPTGGTNYQPIPSPASNNFQGNARFADLC